uniref:ATP synthase subunit b n=1 Tax=Syphacia muris TaxID=451379 RepID=A0A0N5AVX4_9BILA
MSLSRVACMSGKEPIYVLWVQPCRGKGFLDTDFVVKFVVIVKFEFVLAALKSAKLTESKVEAEPSFFKKIYCRFKGIPLKGELAPPRPFFADVDKEFFSPETLPEMSKDFKEYPERDTKNYPYPIRRMYPPKTRMLVFPDSWFTPFYKYTGVSAKFCLDYLKCFQTIKTSLGPYCFFGGLFLFLLNKEIFVIDFESMVLLNWIIIYLIASRAFGCKFF